MEIISNKEKEKIPLKDTEKEFYEKQKTFYIRRKGFCTDANKENKFEICQKVRDYCHYTGKCRRAAHSICILSYEISKQFPVVIDNGSTYDNHFIIKKLAEEFKGQFNCLGENTNDKEEDN